MALSRSDQPLPPGAAAGLAVEEAGVKARIAACEKLLKESKSLTPQRIDQVESAKTAAEIELVGLAAKRDAMQQLLDKVRERGKLEAEITRLRRENDDRSTQIRAVEAGAAACKLTVDEKLPFAQVDGKIRIRRIRWVEPPVPPPAPPPAKATAK